MHHEGLVLLQTYQSRVIADRKYTISYGGVGSGKSHHPRVPFGLGKQHTCKQRKDKDFFHLLTSLGRTVVNLGAAVLAGLLIFIYQPFISLAFPSDETIRKRNESVTASPLGVQE